MRSVIKIHSGIAKHGLKGAIELHFDKEWILLDDESKNITSLIDRVYPEYVEEISKMTNFTFSHKRIPKCELLVSYSNDEIQIRIFHDHIETLREVTGLFLKNFYAKILKVEGAPFEVIGPVTISEAYKNNILDNGAIAIRKRDYISKVWNDRFSEIIFLSAVLLSTVAMLMYIICSFGSPVRETLSYEIVSKLVGPLFASCLLTLTNLMIYYWHLHSKTNIIWGIQPARNS